METRAHYVAVGTFVLAMIFLAFVGVLYFGAVQPTTKYNNYDIYFRGAVSGLNKGAQVEYNGIPVGKVSDIAIDPNDVERIRVTVDIEPKVVIKDDAKAEIQSNLLSGVSYILISRGTQEAPPLVAKAGERYPVIQSRRSALASVSARGPELMEKLNDIADNLNIVLNEQNRKALHDILDNVRMITADFAAPDKEFAGLGTTANATLDSARETFRQPQHRAEVGGQIAGRRRQDLLYVDAGRDQGPAEPHARRRRRGRQGKSA